MRDAEVVIKPAHSTCWLHAGAWGFEENIRPSCYGHSCPRRMHVVISGGSRVICQPACRHVSQKSHALRPLHTLCRLCSVHSTPATSGCVKIARDSEMKRQFTTTPVYSRSQTWQRPAFRRTLRVQHSVRRLTSYPHELRRGAQCRQRRTVQVCFLCWQASLSYLCLKLLEHTLLHAD